MESSGLFKNFANKRNERFLVSRKSSKGLSHMAASEAVWAQNDDIFYPILHTLNGGFKDYDKCWNCCTNSD